MKAPSYPPAVDSQSYDKVRKTAILDLKTTTVRLPRRPLGEHDSLAKVLGVDRSDVIRDAIKLGVKEVRLKLAMKRYSRGEIPLGRAPEIAGVNYWEFVEELRRRGLTLRYGGERFLDKGY